MPGGNVCLVHSDARTDCFRTPLLHSEVGVPSLVLAIALSPVHLSALSRHFRAETAVLTDDRIRTMNEVISGIRVIKMYGWEKPFASLVNEVRRYINFSSLSVSANSH